MSPPKETLAISLCVSHNQWCWLEDGQGTGIQIGRLARNEDSVYVPVTYLLTVRSIYFEPHCMSLT